jgi:FkbM family methyltransferase
LAPHAIARECRSASDARGISFFRISFSQFGEDLAVLRWLDADLKESSRRYVDAGCYHPVYASNTLLLSKRGWTGINIDMTPAKIVPFERMRPRDINCVAALGEKIEMVKAYTYSTGLTDRLADPEETSTRSIIGELPVASGTVQTVTLNEVLRRAGFSPGSFGYLNIDCEGHDLAVLKGIDLEIYLPSVITIEASSAFEQNLAVVYLDERGYALNERLFRTLLFVRREMLKAP